jgi:drug/metabolite transporter (DMT)-like permease
VDVALLAVVTMWASTFTLFKIAWRTVDPVAFTAVRFGSMVVFSAAVLILSRERTRIGRRDLPLIVASGLTGYFLYQMGFVLGLDRTTVLASAILIATHPIFSVLFVSVLERRRPAGMELLGVIVGFAGVAVFLRAWDAFAAARLGDLLSLGAAASFGAYSVLNHRISPHLSQRSLMAWTLGVGGLLVALVGLPAAIRQDWGAVSWQAWVILGYAIVGPVYLAYSVWNCAIRRQGVSRTVVYGFLTPVMAGVLAVVALGERAHTEQVDGAILVVAGLVLTRLASRVSARPVKMERSDA